MKSEAVSFPAVTLCNFRGLDFHVLNRINRLSVKGYQPPPPSAGNPEQQNHGTAARGDVDFEAPEHDDYDVDYRQYVDDHYTTAGDEFMTQYLKFTAKLTPIIASKIYETEPKVRLAIRVSQSEDSYV